MIIHNTTYSVAHESDEEWVQWARGLLLPAISKLPGVSSCKFLKLLTEVENDGVTYTVQTEITSLPAAEEFLTEHTPRLQSLVAEAFPGRVLFFQTLLKVM